MWDSKVAEVSEIAASGRVQILIDAWTKKGECELAWVESAGVDRVHMYVRDLPESENRCARGRRNIQLHHVVISLTALSAFFISLGSGLKKQTKNTLPLFLLSPNVRLAERPRTVIHILELLLTLVQQEQDNEQASKQEWQAIEHRVNERWPCLAMQRSSYPQELKRHDDDDALTRQALATRKSPSRSRNTTLRACCLLLVACNLLLVAIFRYFNRLSGSGSGGDTSAPHEREPMKTSNIDRSSCSSLILSSCSLSSSTGTGSKSLFPSTVSHSLSTRYHSPSRTTGSTTFRLDISTHSIHVLRPRLETQTSNQHISINDNALPQGIHRNLLFPLILGLVLSSFDMIRDLNDMG
ncbi:hypothetical protein BCR44DRAFT_31907 [Catenaria anguillulae PL171]|uniref:Uncharacterized protein n=1 Tax=Catenaria anguillulae PL171 TaxID=765915 RepID=A0A1Y2HLZ4_9FUNG|nr:hypothetical protein BCR44DRAFT_31907 [Catenaria anguillulae PL171]